MPTIDVLRPIGRGTLDTIFLRAKIHANSAVKTFNPEESY